MIDLPEITKTLINLYEDSDCAGEVTMKFSVNCEDNPRYKCKVTLDLVELENEEHNEGEDD